MKTAKQWFDELPEPYRTQALVNCDSNEYCDTLADALFDSFAWGQTTQGMRYWQELHDMIVSGLPLPLPQPDLTQLVREYFAARDQSWDDSLNGIGRQMEQYHVAEMALRKAVGL